MPNKVMTSVSLLLLVRGLCLILLLGLVVISFADECPMFDESTQIPLDEKYLNYWIYDSERAENPYRLTYQNIKDAPLHPYTTIIFMSHGYTGWKDYSPNMEVRPFYLAYTNYTIISLDWSTAAKEGCYIQAAYNVYYVGKSLAHMVDTILETRDDIKCENIRFLGLSLGAHVVGNGGRHVRSCKIPRITALDAALPLFDSFFFSSYSINKNDGAFVDGYHTNCGMKGKMDQYGHVDVYINGCVFQPGCGTNTSCSHSRSADYFGWSIADNVCFKGYKCNSFRDYMSGLCNPPSEDQWVRVGEYIDISLKDVYSAYSSDKPPYFPSCNSS